MAETRDLAPAELDRLEDALEQLEVFGVPDELRARAEDHEIVERLEAYRNVLERTRAAMPMVDVPPGLLDGVLAEAHRNASPMVESRPSLWKRLRLTIVMPALAFAGAAALLVAIVRKDELASGDAESRVARANEATKPDAKSATAPGLVADATPKQDAQGEFAPGDGERAGAAQQLTDDKPAAEGIATEARAAEKEDDGLEHSLGRAKGSAAPGPSPKSEKKPPSTPSGADDPLDFDEKKKDKGKTAGADVPKSEPPPPAKPSAQPKPPEPEPNEPQTPAPGGSGSGGSAPPEPGGSAPPEPGGSEVGWSTIEQADAQRRAGKCGLARIKYEQAKKATDAKIRARAFAGIGLCERAEGNAAGAEQLFKQARAQDPKIDAFIADEKD